MSESKTSGEMSIIDTYFAPLAEGSLGAVDLKDDAGYLEVPEGCSLALTTDAIVEGIHFLAGTAPHDIAYKALAVNVSDLCAKGADPTAYLLTIALPQSVDSQFLEGVQSGLSAAQAEYGCSLLGGDTIRTDGPVLIAITLAGVVQIEKKVHRAGAKPGDLVYVTGTIGDAALGLSLCRGEGTETRDVLNDKQTAHLKQRYLRPNARLEAISLVRDFATASMDISDGLVGDLEKLAAASGVGAALNSTGIPLSDAATLWLAAKPETIESILTGGDDYEVMMTVPAADEDTFLFAAKQTKLDVTRIGHVTPHKTGVQVFGNDGELLKLMRTSYDHF